MKIPEKIKNIYIFLDTLGWIILLLILSIESYAYFVKGYLILPTYFGCCGSMISSDGNDFCIAGIKNVNRDYILETDKGRIAVNDFPDENDIKPGDIVDFKYRTSDFWVHRVVGYCPENATPPVGVYTKGDNNKERDPWCVPFWAIENKYLWLKCLS